MASRERSWQRFEELVMTSPTAIGRELGTRENKREEALRDAESGGLFALLASLESGEAGPLPNLVRDRAEFDKYFLRDSNEEHSISGVGLTRKTTLQELAHAATDPLERAILHTGVVAVKCLESACPRPRHRHPEPWLGIPPFARGLGGSAAG